MPQTVFIVTTFRLVSPSWNHVDEVSIAAKTDLICKSHDAQTDRERWRRKRQSILLAQRILVCHTCTRIRI